MIKRITAAIAAACMMCSITSYAADNTLLTLDYTDSKELITSSDDLFSNIDTLMPGDVVSDTLSITNKNNNGIELFFKSVPLSEDKYYLTEDYELLNKINLNIEFMGKSIYNGSLIGTELNNIINLGKFKSGESGDFKFTLSVPGDLTNKFNMTATKVKWYFAVTEDAIPVTPTTNPQDKITIKDTTPSPYTGAAVGTLGISGLLVASAISIFKNRKEGKYED